MRRDLTAFAGSARSLWLVVACVATGCTGVVGGLEGAEGDRSPRPGNAAVGRGGTASGSGATGGGLSGGGLSGGASTGTGAGGVAGGSQGTAGSGQQTTSKVVRQPLRPLTPFELDNALRDLLGDESGSALALRSDVAKKLTETAPNANLIGLASFRALEDLSLTAARAFAASPDQRLGCAQGTAIEPCTQSFVRAFARRAFRRPPTDVEVARYAGIRAALEPAQGRPEALARTLQAIVLSPSFLYLTTLGANDAAAQDGSTDVPLSKDELAAHLAFFLWASLPDEALLAAADAGSLATEAGLASEVDRMLGDPRAQNAVGRFVLGWLGVLDLTRAKKTYAGFDGALARSMQEETTTLVRDWFVKGERGVSALLEADYSFVDENLATFYGLTGTAKVTGDAAVRVQLADQTNRRGVLSHASWLAAHGNESGSGPLHRGQWIWEHALCGEPREAPANAANKAPAFTPDLTTRQWNEAIASSCGGKCHQQMAPLGYVFEGFDGIGRARTLDNGKAVQTSTTPETGVATIDHPMTDNRDFATALASSERVTSCVAEHWLSYALAIPRDALDEATRISVATSLDQSGKGAMRAIALSSAFRAARRTISVPVSPQGK